jgi:sugar lactone lactonase YvrE
VSKSIVLIPRIMLWLVVLVGLTGPAMAQDFRYQRLWPALQQPWYYVNTRSIAVDPNDQVFVVDSFNHRIHRYSRDGRLTFRFGSEGVAPGQLMFPIAIASDAGGNLYVAETDTGDFRRIQKFDPTGKSLLSFGGFGDGPGEFGVGAPEDNGLSPFDIEVDAAGNLWVSGSNRLQQFDSQGNFLRAIPPFGASSNPLGFVTGFDLGADGSVFALAGENGQVKVFDSAGNLDRTFGSAGFGPGQIFLGNDLEIDSQGRIYIADGGSSKIVRYEANESDFIEFGEFGTEPGQFQLIWRLDFDAEGTLYIVDTGDDDFSMHRVQKFTADGEFLAEWSAAGTTKGRFITPSGVAVDSQDRVYVADERNHRVQVFSSAGAYLFDFGAFGSGPGQFNAPSSIAIGPPPDEAIYVSEFLGGRIQRFDASGQFDSAATSAGGLSFPGALAIDAAGSVYVTDSGTDMVRKFDPDLGPLTQWGGHTECFDENGFPLSCTDGLFNSPFSLTVDSSTGSDRILVGDYFNRRVQRFDSNGNFLSRFETEFFPTAIEAADNGDVFLLPFSDSRSNTGHFFTRLDANGTPLGFWGEFGSNPGQLNSPLDLTLDSAGRVIVADSLNHRITVFSDDPAPAAKAVIVAGGGPFAGNTLWPATQLNGNFAYRSLTQQGFTRDTIFYLSADTGLDLDGNGLADDIDAPASNADLQTALTQWAMDADEVFVYLVDHGGDQTFRMGGAEVLSASQLTPWIDELQAAIPGRLTLLYDACQSGSFLSALSDPSSDRVLMTSAADDQSAFFVDGGALSFSNHFFTQVFNGASVGEAFETARTITEASFPSQTPLLDANGDGSFNAAADRALVDTRFLGNGNLDPGDRPVIASVSPAQVLASGNSATLFANGLSDDDTVARVWAVIQPPGSVLPRDASDPVRELPRLELSPANAQRSNWQGVFSTFDSAGTYTIVVNAIDSFGNRAVPMVTTVEVVSPLARKAIILDTLAGFMAGKGAGENASQAAYLALTAQDYSDDDIQYMAPVMTAGVDAPPSRAAFQDALNSATASPVQDLTVVLISNTDESGNVELGDTTATTIELDGMTKPTATAIAGTYTLIVDGNRSGAVLADQSPADDQILISSAASDQPSRFLAEGKISFTRAFWEQVELGASVQQAFVAAENFLATSPDRQIPQLEDNANGLGNDGQDGARARQYTIGAGIVVAGDAPLIGDISPAQTINAASSASIEVEGVTTTGEITAVFALITPPGSFDQSELGPGKLDFRDLDAQAPGRFRLDYDGFDMAGEYSIAVYAVDSLGKVSQPAVTRVTRLGGDPVAGFAVNAGISGTWFDPSHDGEGWLIQVLDADTALIYWFTYAPTGEGDDRQVWIGAQPGRIDGGNIVIDGLITTAGPRFGPSFDSADLALTTWGDVTFHFDDCQSGQMSYSGAEGYGQGRLDLVRLTSIAGTDCATAQAKGTGVNDRMSGTWFDPSHNGEGWLLEILPGGSALSVWFTYDETGRQAWLISLGTVTGSRIDFDLVQRPVGAFFGSTFDPALVNRDNWGSMQFEFTSCNAGTMSYQSSDPNFGSGSLNLTPLSKIQGLPCDL